MNHFHAILGSLILTLLAGNCEAHQSEDACLAAYTDLGCTWDQALSTCAGRHVRLLGKKWVHCRDDDSHVGRVLRPVTQLLSVVDYASGNGHVSRCLAALRDALLDSGGVPQLMVGRCIRWAWALRSVQLHSHDLRVRLSAWPSSGSTSARAGSPRHCAASAGALRMGFPPHHFPQRTRTPAR